MPPDDEFAAVRRNKLAKGFAGVALMVLGAAVAIVSVLELDALSRGDDVDDQDEEVAGGSDAA